MKTQNKNTAIRLDKLVNDSFYQETKEIVANNIQTNNHKTMLSSAELWNIQRQMRTRTGRRFFI